MGLNHKSPEYRRVMSSIEDERSSFFDRAMRSKMFFIEKHRPEERHELPKGWTSAKAHERVNKLAGELGFDKSIILGEIMHVASSLYVSKGGAEEISDDDLFEMAFSKVDEDLKRSFFP